MLFIFGREFILAREFRGSMCGMAGLRWTSHETLPRFHDGGGIFF